MNLKDYKQEQLLNFYSDLNLIQKLKLKKQIKNINYEFINKLFDNC